MKIGIITFTSAGYQLGESLCEKLQAVGHKTELFRCGKDMLNDWTSRHFATDDALVFIGATGIAIRAVAPYLKSKTSDPAVVVIDELGRFVIPLLAGHIGGANRLAQNLAKLLEALQMSLALFLSCYVLSESKHITSIFTHLSFPLCLVATSANIYLVVFNIFMLVCNATSIHWSKINNLFKTVTFSFDFYKL
jgi:hypothetical protein